ncbi:FAD-binding oxidoreductase [Endozoicomonas sp. SCSIO W0465]|uniref:NAD(P)/FAD-dependent oxidoreductase n=1 Tax=Endozoicomonas sp. SCSIO W0465 TaxID=2918516 RepID=UPI00207554A2|nr:FAD-binding oxidoreductase [Endozoicomonas sp. SCSIO W0465]USE35066.1 FAD-binding oxidoreductase [Endozoicomonas sp. SCSIO W0465]
MKLKAPVHTDAHADSYYAASLNFATDYPELEGNLSVDICVVGGGFSGVATALELAERGYRVAVLEARKIGWGATGRNGGQLIRGIGTEPEQFSSQIGTDGVEAIHQMGFEAVELVRERVRKYDIQCDLKMGYVDAAIKAKQMDHITEDYQSLKKRHYAHELRLLSQDDIKQYVNSDRYMGGMLDSGSGHLHPLNLCLGEARVAEGLGVQFFENSPVVKIHKGNLPGVATAKGSVTCQFLVLAGNAYLGNLEPTIGGKVLPAGSYIIATEKLQEKVWQNLIPNDSAICDVSIALDYFRLSADKRLLFGGMCNYSGRDPNDIVASLRPKMLRVFPQLENTTIEYQWGGMIGIGANRMPQIGRLGSNIYFAQAYSGHGVNATHMAGRVLAEAISGQAERFDVFANIRHMTFPGGRYFRSPLLALGMLWYRLKEAV